MQKGSKNLDLCEIRGKIVNNRCDTAKRFKLCFRCLGDGHRGKLCQKLWHVGKWMYKIASCAFTQKWQLVGKNKINVLYTKKPFPTRTCHNPSGARRKETNNLDWCTEGNDKTKQLQIETQGNHSANLTGLPTVPILTQEDRRCKVGNTPLNFCTKVGIAIELENQSVNTVRDGNFRLHWGDKTAHLISEEERQEIPHILTEGNYTAECIKVLQIFA